MFVTAPVSDTLRLGIAVGQSRSSDANVDFKGRYIVAVSDADMVPSAYIDGHLGPVEGSDALSVIRLNKPVRDPKAVAIGVSNSVTGPPSVVAVTPDGRYAVVIETWGHFGFLLRMTDQKKTCRHRRNELRNGLIQY